MTFEFGAFRLDEPGRVLRLAERELPLQPRIFDLLVYLVRHRARVVSKDELLDALWPGVTVTDNSVQRAVSALRGVLRQGGMDGAIRNFPRNGYRFCLDDEPDEAGRNADGTKARAGGIEAARAAVRERRWIDAVALYGSVSADALTGDDFDGRALAHQCSGRPSDAIPVLIRAIEAHTQAGASDRAAASAISLAVIHLERGELAVAKGWIARAQDLVAETPPAIATGLALWMQSRVALFEGNSQQALEFADAAYEFGRRRNDIRTEALGLMYRGFHRLSVGETSEGLADQDHAAALSLSNSIDPVTGGTLYCNLSLIHI